LILAVAAECLAERLTRAGYDVLGIDISESMLKLARKRAPKARFVRGSLFQVKLPECVAVTAVGSPSIFIRPTSGGGAAVGLSVGLAAFFRRVYHALFSCRNFRFRCSRAGLGIKTAFAAL